MTGANLANARHRLGLFQVEVARILVADDTTVYRWEHSPEPRIDPLRRELVLTLVGLSASPAAMVFGDALRQALKVGPTYALHMLLKMAHGEWRAKRP